MFWVLPQATAVADTLAYVDSLPAPGSVARDDGGLGIWGLKLGMDGGVEGGFLCEPYANNPAFRGHAFWEPDDFGQVVEHAVGRGWRVGCHAVGDCAVRRVLDAYQQVALRHPGLPPGTLVIEHAFLADAQARARAVRLGIGITIQHPLLYSLGGNLVRYWGQDRTSQVMPVRAWVDEGALIAMRQRLQRPASSTRCCPSGGWSPAARARRESRARSTGWTPTRPSGSTPRQAAERCSARIAASGSTWPRRIRGYRGVPRRNLLDCPVDDLPSQQPAPDAGRR